VNAFIFIIIAIIGAGLLQAEKIDSLILVKRKGAGVSTVVIILLIKFAALAVRLPFDSIL